MALLVSLYPASFRGVGFYCADSSMDSGRKQVTHEFPNSDRRYVEDLGRFQNIYKLQALVTGNSASYFQNRNALISALEQPGIGLLVHPFYGTVSVVPKQFTVQENFGRLGEALFSLTFERAQIALTPQGDTINLSNLSLLASLVMGNLGKDIGKIFSLFGSYPNNFKSAQGIISSIVDAFSTNTRTFTQSQDSINGFSTSLNDYSNSGNSLILDPPLLGTQTMGLFDQTSNLISSPSDLLGVLSNFYDFNNNVQPIPPTTFEWIQRQNNLNVMQAGIQAGALTQSYVASANITYGNIVELNTVQNQLETQFQALIDNPALSDTTKTSLQDLRNISRLFFEGKKINVNQITPIFTYQQPLTTLTYQYYGSLDNVEAINNLNGITNNAFVDGLINILTS